MKQFPRIVLFLAGFCLVVAGLFYKLLAPVRVNQNIDNYESRLKSSGVEQVGDPVLYNPNDIVGLADLARIGWSHLEDSSSIMLVLGSIVIASALCMRPTVTEVGGESSEPKLN